MAKSGGLRLFITLFLLIINGCSSIHFQTRSQKEQLILDQYRNTLQITVPEQKFDVDSTNVDFVPISIFLRNVSNDELMLVLHPRCFSIHDAHGIPMSHEIQLYPDMTRYSFSDIGYTCMLAAGDTLNYLYEVDSACFRDHINYNIFFIYLVPYNESIDFWVGSCVSDEMTIKPNGIYYAQTE